MSERGGRDAGKKLRDQKFTGGRGKKQSVSAGVFPYMCRLSSLMKCFHRLSSRLPRRFQVAQFSPVLSLSLFAILPFRIRISNIILGECKQYTGICLRDNEPGIHESSSESS